MRTMNTGLMIWTIVIQALHVHHPSRTTILTPKITPRQRTKGKATPDTYPSDHQMFLQIVGLGEEEAVADLIGVKVAVAVVVEEEEEIAACLEIVGGLHSVENLVEVVGLDNQRIKTGDQAKPTKFPPHDPHLPRLSLSLVRQVERLTIPASNRNKFPPTLARGGIIRRRCNSSNFYISNNNNLRLGSKCIFHRCSPTLIPDSRLRLGLRWDLFISNNSSIIRSINIRSPSTAMRLHLPSSQVGQTNGQCERMNVPRQVNLVNPGIQVSSFRGIRRMCMVVIGYQRGCGKDVKDFKRMDATFVHMQGNFLFFQDPSR